MSKPSTIRTSSNSPWCQSWTSHPGSNEHTQHRSATPLAAPPATGIQRCRRPRRHTRRHRSAARLLRRATARTNESSGQARDQAMRGTLDAEAPPAPGADSGRSRRRACSSQQSAEADRMAGHTSLDTPTRTRGHRSTRPDRLFKEPRRTCSRDCKQSLRAGPVKRPKTNDRRRSRQLRPKSALALGSSIGSTAWLHP